jgi:hypothetical protein
MGKLFNSNPVNTQQGLLKSRHHARLPGATDVTSERTMVHKGTSSLRLIGEAGTPGTWKEKKMSVHFQKEAAVSQKARSWVGSRTLAVYWTSWANLLSLFPHYPPHKAEKQTKPRSGTLILPFSSTLLQKGINTEWEGPIRQGAQGGLL